MLDFLISNSNLKRADTGDMTTLKWRRFKKASGGSSKERRINHVSGD